MQRSIVNLVALTALAGAGPAASAAPPVGAIELDRVAYTDQIEGFWLAQCIANWTGLQTEAARTEPPFYTDADWPSTFDGRTLGFVLDQDPWKADDDTDIEYVYAKLMCEHHRPDLTPEQIRDGWIAHINDFIWVSNERARELMGRGVSPPSTSVPAANSLYLMIDAQLTTEFFGIFAPGMPRAALQLADLPIRTTARGHAAHASQYLVVLHALAAARGPDALNPAGIEQLVEDALVYIPQSSKAADVVRLVLDDYRANPNADDWERTRDLLAHTFQTHASDNGYRYLGWFESSVNFGSAIVCLLYGQGDLAETIRIGTLTGWDADNPTATMGGLIGLMLGADGVRASFPDAALSDRYWVSRTRDAMPDYLPSDPDAEDLLSALSRRMLNRVDDTVRMNAGIANATSWLIPPQPEVELLHDNPWYNECLRSANNIIRLAGGTVTASYTPNDAPANLDGSPSPGWFVNGREHEVDGVEPSSNLSRYFWTRGVMPDQLGRVTLQAAYSAPVQVHTIRFIEGDHFADGGWFETLSAEARISGVWTPLSFTQSEPLDPHIPFQIIDLVLDDPVRADAIRISGTAGGSARFITASELDAFSAPVTRELVTWDINNDGLVDIDDLYDFDEQPADIDGDGDTDSDDYAELERAVRWRELDLLRGSRR
ncbi:MAG: ADP-ribosylglycohydrolase family protein [Phycisphaerales bacterium]